MLTRLSLTNLRFGLAGTTPQTSFLASPKTPVSLTAQSTTPPQTQVAPPVWLPPSALMARYASPAGPTSDATPLKDRIRLVIKNDTHEKYDKAASLVTGFQQANQQGQQAGIDTLNLSAGDFNIGREPQEMELNVLLENMMNIHAAVQGNHGYDGGAAMMAESLKKAHFKLLQNNMRIPPGSSLDKAVQDGRITTEPQIWCAPSGEQYGIVGMEVPDLKTLLHPDANMEGADTETFPQSLARVQADVNRLLEKGLNRIILLSHAGYDKDIQIARQVKGIDIIVGGHTHTELDDIKPESNYIYNNYGEPVVIFQTGKDNHAFGVFDGAWTPEGHILPLQNKLYDPRQFPKNPAALSLLDSHLGPTQIIGQMASDVSTENVITGGENALANAVADAARIYTGSEIALFRGTQIRNSLNVGEFTDRDLKMLMPFNNPLVQFQMTGRDIQEVLDESARCVKVHEGHPGMIHPAGLRYQIDLSTGKANGILVWDNASRRWAPLDSNRQYTVCSDEFIAKNKTEYPTFKRVPVLRQFPISEREAFGNWIKNQQGSPVQLKTDGRTALINPGLN